MSERLSKSDRFSRLVVWAPLLVGCLSLVAAVFAIHRTYSLSLEKSNQALVSQITDFESETLTRLSYLNNLLLGFSGLFNASQSVDSNEWTLYRDSQAIDEYFPEVVEVGYIQYSRPNRFQVRYGGDYIKPGSDVSKSTSLLDVATRARDTGESQISSEAENLLMSGSSRFLVMMSPLYSQKTPPPNLLERRKDIEGFTYAIVDFDLLMRDRIHSFSTRLSSQIDLEVFSSIEGSNRHILFDRRPDIKLSDDGYRLIKESFVIGKYGYKIILRAIKPDTYESEIVFRETLMTVILALLGWMALTGFAYALSRTRRKAEKLAKVILARAKESEKRADEIMKLSPVGIFQANVEGAWTYANDFWKLAFGYKISEQLYDFRWINNVHPKDRKKLSLKWSDAIRTKNPFTSEHRYITASGQAIWVRCDVSPTFNDENQHSGFLGAVSDISKARQAETAIANEAEKLKESQERYALAVQGSNDGIWDWNIRDDEVFFSNRLRELLGYNSEEFKNSRMSAIRFVHPDDRQPLRKAVRRHLVRGGQFSNEFRMLTSNEDYRWFLSRGQAVWDKNGLPVRISGSLTDVHERRETEQRLWRSNQLQQSILNNANFMIISTDTHGMMKTFNKAAERQLGYLNEELLDKKNITLFFTDSEIQAQVEILSESLNEHLAPNTNPVIELPKRGIREEKEWTFTRKDGSQFPCKLAVNDLRDPEGNLYGFLLTGSDITDQKIASEAQRRQREIFEQVISNAPTAIAMLDTDMRYLTHSDQWLEDYSLQGQEILGRSHYEIFPNIPDRWKEDHRRALKGEQLSCDEDSFEHADGSKTYLRWGLHPWYRANGEVGGLVMATQSIDELVEARQKAIDAMDAKSDFLANMSHEIRTPMNGVIGVTDLLSETSLDLTQKKYVEIVRDSSVSLLSIINDILDFSKMEAGKMKVENVTFSLRKGVKSQIELLTPRANDKGLNLSLEIDDNIPDYLEGDPGRIGQIILNLLGNAIKFTKKGDVSVVMRLVGMEENLARVRFEIQDTGKGIAKSQAEKMFQPFTQADGTSQRRHGGTGLGLSISKKLCELMNGDIGFESQLGKGSTFWFEIPLKVSPEQTDSALGESDEDRSLTEQQDSLNRMKSQNISILLAEDNAVNQLVTKLQIEKYGFKIDIANNGFEVLSLMQEKSYDLVLMDCQMPEMDGFEATKKIRENEKISGKHIPIIALTANVLDEDRKKCLQIGMDDFLPKPVKKSILRNTLIKWLDKENSAVPAIDYQVFQTLIEIDNEEFELIKDLNRLFSEKTPQYLKQIAEGLNEQNAEKISSAAHTMKSSCAQVGAIDLSAVAKEIEKLAKRDELERIESLYSRALDNFEVAKKELNEIVQKSVSSPKNGKTA